MRAIFNEELQQVADDLIAMASAVHIAVDRAGQALFSQDIETAQDVIDGDKAIDALEHKINDQCVTLLAKQSPVATDLRIVVSTMSIASLLERMGDLARHIAETSRSTYPDSPFVPRIADTFTRMQSFALTTTQTLTNLVKSHDEDAAQQLIINDDVMDKLFESVVSSARNDDWDATTEQIINTVLLSRYYERMGDHAVSVARRLVYMVSGFDPTKDPSRFIGVDGDGD
ncbi:phosphate signaling complex protein PhoU [Alloscardovia venturai]|uniref:Phosphate-specific transport system accessory protein PhoU n=1 Tax=Alloscardovia venturai TaxID=1769421 RepID=A0ABW2Y5E1_9BIFI